MQHQVETWQRAAVLRRPLIAAALVAAASLADAPRLSPDRREASYHSGTLIAALVTRSEILLCSDGRVVNSLDRTPIREDWPKVHRLTTRAGLLTAGRTVCEAFVVLHWLERACQAQVMAMACNTELNHPAAPVIRVTQERYAPGNRRKITELEWPALLRMLDRRDPGFRE